MQQRVLAQVGRYPQLRRQLRAADGNEFVPEDKDRVLVGPRRRADANQKVAIVNVHLGVRGQRGDLEVDTRAVGKERYKSRCEPSHGECRRELQAQSARFCLRLQFGHSLLQIVEASRELLHQQLAERRQLVSPVGAVEQLDLQALLELANLLRDRARCQVQLLAGQLQAAIASGGFERPQRRQGKLVSTLLHMGRITRLAGGDELLAFRSGYIYTLQM